MSVNNSHKPLVEYLEWLRTRTFENSPIFVTSEDEAGRRTHSTESDDILKPKSINPDKEG